LAFSEDTKEDAMLAIREQESIEEKVIISTCNNEEIFSGVESVEAGKETIEQFFVTWFRLEEDDFIEFLQITHDEDAINHLYKLTVGLNSMVLGETQILSQVREAFITAQQLKVTGKIFNELFKRAITFAKSAHSHTIIGEQAVSMSYVAVELSKKIFGKMKGTHAVIIGAGEMG